MVKLISRIPHGMRGLKCDENLQDPVVVESHPAWDAWIEIYNPGTYAKRSRVASRMGCVD